MTRKEIEAERDRLAVENMAKSNQSDNYWNYVVQKTRRLGFIDGSEAAIALMLKREQVLRDALENCEGRYRHCDHNGEEYEGDYATEALEQVPPWEGE